MFLKRFFYFLIIGALFLCSCSSKKSNPESIGAAPVPVLVAKVRLVRQPATIAMSGSVESPSEPANLAFLVSGKVIRVNPREGEFVKKGDVLAVIDPTDYQLALDASVAQTSAARAISAKAQAPARPEQLEQARVAFMRAEDEYRRMKMLYESKSLAPNDFKKFEAAWLGSKEQYDLAKVGAQKEDKAQALAGLEQAAAAERMARKRLADTTLYSSIDGYIARRTIEPGETAGPGRPVFSLVSLNPVEVRVGVPESDIRLVRTGQTATIRVPALPDMQFSGTVRVVSVSADPSTRTYMARITVPNPKQLLRVGMIAEAQIRGDQEVDLMTLPGDSIVRDPQGATMVYVYFPDQKRVYAKRVEAGGVYGKDIQIKSGLAGDELIVTGGQRMLREGLLVDASEDRR
jgi:RND family efflux transporter MFP subunit